MIDIPSGEAQRDIMKTVKAIVFEEVGQVGFGEFELGVLARDEIMVETAYTFVSPGTELRVLGGHYGADGQFPLVPGYSVVGQVAEVGPEAKGWCVGDWVSGRNPRPLPGIYSQWGGQASTHIYATKGEDRPVLLPQNCTPLDYVIAETAAISRRGAEAARPFAGESAVVIGQGIIGAYSAAWLHHFGCRVAVVDLEESRLERALKLGATLALRADDTDVVERLQAFLNGGADIVVEASGVRPGVELAYKLLRKKPQNYSPNYVVEPIHLYGGDWPRLVMQANYLDEISHNPHGFTPGEGVVVLSPSDRGIEDRQRTVEDLRRGHIKSADFLDLIAPVAEAPQAYRALANKERFSVVFDWRLGL
jgi:2-desacetyl-2-hydroxyethyl bacteriochlorophyllide A dehydrogenase